MKTWNPVRMVRNLFACANSTDPAGRDAFWSAGLRLTAWGISLIFAGYLAYKAVAAATGYEGSAGLSDLLWDTERKIVSTVLSLRGAEGLLEDIRARLRPSPAA